MAVGGLARELEAGARDLGLGPVDPVDEPLHLALGLPHARQVFVELATIGRAEPSMEAAGIRADGVENRTSLGVPGERRLPIGGGVRHEQAVKEPLGRVFGGQRRARRVEGERVAVAGPARARHVGELQRRKAGVRRVRRGDDLVDRDAVGVVRAGGGREVRPCQPGVRPAVTALGMRMPEARDHRHVVAVRSERGERRRERVVRPRVGGQPFGDVDAVGHVAADQSRLRRRRGGERLERGGGGRAVRQHRVEERERQRGAGRPQEVSAREYEAMRSGHGRSSGCAAGPTW